MDCRSCTTDLECGGDARCLRLGNATACLEPCGTDRDCPPSYTCYGGRPEGSFCLPVSYACVPCAFDAPCTEGQTCDLVTGLCKAALTICCPCTWDFDCGSGQRCYNGGHVTGACVDECSDARPCVDADNFACGDDSHGVPVCRPLGAPKCGGCPANRPFPAPGCGDCRECLEDSHCRHDPLTACDPSTHRCVADPPRCLNDSHCGLDEHCDTETNTCGGFCPGELHQCTDGLCRECCRDEDCALHEGPCRDGLCQGAPDPCNGQCGGTSFPICKAINGVPQCIQCQTDWQCAGIDAACKCSGDPTYTCLRDDGNVCSWYQPACLATEDCAALDPACTCTGDPTYQCVWPDGAPCQGPSCGEFCSIDAECPTGADGLVRRCSAQGGSGVCIDPAGSCNGLSTCCGAGQYCVSLTNMLPPESGGMPPTVPDRVLCTCDALRPCLGDVPCLLPADLCALPHLGPMLYPFGVPTGNLDRGLCADGAALDAWAQQTK